WTGGVCAACACRARAAWSDSDPCVRMTRGGCFLGLCGGFHATPAAMMHALDPAEPAALPARLRGRVEALQAEAAELAARNARLEHLVREFQAALYGPRSEKLYADERQLCFEDLEVAIALAESAQEAGDPSAPARKRKAPRRNLGRLPAELPRI